MTWLRYFLSLAALLGLAALASTAPAEEPKDEAHAGAAAGGLQAQAIHNRPHGQHSHAIEGIVVDVDHGERSGTGSITIRHGDTHQHRQPANHSRRAAGGHHPQTQTVAVNHETRFEKAGGNGGARPASFGEVRKGDRVRILLRAAQVKLAHVVDILDAARRHRGSHRAGGTGGTAGTASAAGRPTRRHVFWHHVLVDGRKALRYLGRLADRIQDRWQARREARRERREHFKRVVARHALVGGRHVAHFVRNQVAPRIERLVDKHQEHVAQRKAVGEPVHTPVKNAATAVAHTAKHTAQVKNTPATHTPVQHNTPAHHAASSQHTSSHHSASHHSGGRHR